MRDNAAQERASRRRRGRSVVQETVKVPSYFEKPSEGPGASYGSVAGKWDYQKHDITGDHKDMFNGWHDNPTVMGGRSGHMVNRCQSQPYENSFGLKAAFQGGKGKQEGRMEKIEISSVRDNKSGKEKEKTASTACLKHPRI